MRSIATLALLVALAAGALAQQDTRPAGDAPTKFAAPVKITSSADGFDKVIYPSPTLFDIDGDGVRELVVGDLVGNIWVSEPGEGDVAWGKRKALRSGGRPLRLNNW